MVKNEFDKWRVSWLEGNRMQYRYYRTDYKAIKHHLNNLRKSGVFGGAMLAFRIKGYNSFAPVGGCDSILGLTHGVTFLGKTREYWEKLIQRAKKEIIVDGEETSI